MAVAGIYKALGQELHMHLTNEDVRVQVALLNAAVAIGLSTNTADMGIMGGDFTMERAHAPGQRVITPEQVPCDHVLKVNAAFAHPCTLERGHEEDHVWSDDVVRAV
jgi:hypothetical protein